MGWDRLGRTAAGGRRQPGQEEAIVLDDVVRLSPALAPARRSARPAASPPPAGKGLCVCRRRPSWSIGVPGARERPRQFLSPRDSTFFVSSSLALSSPPPGAPLGTAVDRRFFWRMTRYQIQNDFPRDPGAGVASPRLPVLGVGCPGCGPFAFRVPRAPSRSPFACPGRRSARLSRDVGRPACPRSDRRPNLTSFPICRSVVHRQRVSQPRRHRCRSRRFPRRLCRCVEKWAGRACDGGVACARSLVAHPFCRVCAGALYGTYESFRYKIPGLYKIRFIGQTTLSSAAIFGVFLGAGSLLHCGK